MEIIDQSFQTKSTNVEASAGLSILIPCFQEEKNIPELVTRIVSEMEKIHVRWEAVLVDDGSRDSTWNAIESVGQKDERFKGIRHPSNQGIAAAWESALNQASMEWVLTMDADLQFSPQEIPKLIDKMNSSNCDIVQGKRMKRLDSRYRTALSAVLSSVLKVLFHLPFEDVKSGFILYKKEAFCKIINNRRAFRHFENWIIVAASSMGFTISQVEVTVYPRNAGKSYITSPLLFGLATLRDIPALLLNYRIRRQKP